MQIINDNNILFTVATANLLNLALPNSSFYENRDPYKPPEYEEKCNWLGAQFCSRMCRSCIGKTATKPWW